MHKAVQNHIYPYLRLIDTDALEIQELHSPIITVWGEGDPELPYDRRRYHLGHLCMITLLRAIGKSRRKILVLLTADTLSELTGRLPNQFYDGRTYTLRRWLEDAIEAPDLEVILASEVIQRLKDDKQYKIMLKAWAAARTKLDSYLLELSQAYDKIPSGEKEQIQNVWNGVRNGKGTWDSCRSHLPGDMCTIIEGIEREQCGDTFPGDVECLVYLACEKRKSWLYTQWLVQVGSLLCSDLFSKGDLLEAARNMYVWRAFRFYQSLAQAEAGVDLFMPRLVQVSNFPNLQSSSFMNTRDESGILRIFEEDEKIMNLPKASRSFQTQLMERIVSPNARDLLEVEVTLADYSASGETSVMEDARDLTFQILQHYRDKWPPRESKNLHINNWFCIRYALSNVITNKQDRQSLRRIFSVYVDVDVDLYREQYVRLASSIVSQVNKQAALEAKKSKEKTIDSLWEVIQNLLKSTIDLDVLLHLSGKRYRDHSLHQMHVAILGHLFLSALTPRSTYREQETVIEALSKQHRVSPTDLWIAWWIAALLHDHAYPLLHLLKLSSVLSQLETYLYGVQANVKTLQEALVAFASGSLSELLREVLSEVQDIKSSHPFQIRHGGNLTLREKAMSILNKAGDDLPEPVGHGLLSAVNLYSLLSTKEGDPQSYPPLTRALSAMALHDTEFPISFQDNPIAFILVLCDELQEWSRRMFWGEKQQVESNYVEIGPIKLISEEPIIYQLSDRIEATFYRVDLEISNVPWDFNIFREAKQRNFNRLKWPEKPDIFPTDLHFDIKIDCGPVRGT